jgi:hypothetical protein
VKHRKGALITLLRPFGDIAYLGEENSQALWRRCGDARRLLQTAVGRTATVARLDRTGKSQRDRKLDPREC